MKVGDEFFNAVADAHEGTVYIQHWIITVIREGRAFAVQKTDYTWVKRSSKTGDYGWAKSISDWEKHRFRLEDGPPDGWAKTKAAAYSKALPEIEAAIKKLSKLRAQLTGQRTKARARTTPKKAALTPTPEATP